MIHRNSLWYAHSQISQQEFSSHLSEALLVVVGACHVQKWFVHPWTESGVIDIVSPTDVAPDVGGTADQLSALCCSLSDNLGYGR